MSSDVYDVVPIILPAAVIERELCRVEEAIVELTQSDGFIEDLIGLHAQRKALVAALPKRPAVSRQSGALSPPPALPIPLLEKSETGT